jgi:hypothetical protein
MVDGVVGVTLVAEVERCSRCYRLADGDEMEMETEMLDRRWSGGRKGGGWWVVGWWIYRFGFQLKG